MKIHQICPKNIVLKDLKKLKKFKNNKSMVASSHEPKLARFGHSTICYYPEVKTKDVVRVSKSAEVKETKFDKFLTALDDFAEPIYISKESMKDYAKQVFKRVADWKRIFG